MIGASTLVALPLLAIALIARRLRSDLEETAWRLMAVVMLVTPFAALLPKVDVGVWVTFPDAEPLFSLPMQEVSGAAAPPVLVYGYALVAAVLLARLAIAVATAWKLRRDAEPFGGAYLSASLRVPVTAGLVAPAILLPPDAPAWSAAKLAAVLAHERAHVVRRDPLWRFVGRAAVAISWFHPLAWLAASAMERIAEETADREAIAVTGDRHEYANVLLDLLRVMAGNRRRLLVGVSMLDGRALGTRIDAILQPERTRRSRIFTRGLLATLVPAAIFLTGMTKHEPAPPVAGVHQNGSRENPTETATEADLEFFRKRDEIRDGLRKRIRETAQALARGFVND